MLKLLYSSSSSRVHCLTTAMPNLRVKPDSNLVFHALGRLTGLTWRSPTNSLLRACFCSDSSGVSGSQPAVEVEVKGAKSESNESDLKASSTTLPTYPRPEDYLTLLEALHESRKRQAPYAGAFLLKDEPGTESSHSSETEKSACDIKGKDLFNRLHEVGTLAEISSIQGDQVLLIGHRQLRVTEMVSDDPLTVKVDHLKVCCLYHYMKNLKDDDVIKATSFEVISILRDVFKTSSHWSDRDHDQRCSELLNSSPCICTLPEIFLQSVLIFPRLADFGATISGANKLQCQQVLEELDVRKHLQLSLKLVKEELEISKSQESDEEKRSGKAA
ncbi:hypothetical protein REPUB_Repub06bG0006000 [Reevesia pubescens]